MYFTHTCLNIILLIGKVIDTLITAAPHPQTNSLQSLLLNVNNDLSETFCEATLLILILCVIICSDYNLVATNHNYIFYTISSLHRSN